MECGIPTSKFIQRRNSISNDLLMRCKDVKLQLSRRKTGELQANNIRDAFKTVLNAVTLGSAS